MKRRRAADVASIIQEHLPDAVAIYERDPQTCTKCRKVAELRPYGYEFTEVCYACGNADPLIEQRMSVVTFHRPVPPQLVAEYETYLRRTGKMSKRER